MNSNSNWIVLLFSTFTTIPAEIERERERERGSSEWNVENVVFVWWIVNAFELETVRLCVSERTNKRAIERVSEWKHSRALLWASDALTE